MNLRIRLEKLGLAQGASQEEISKVKEQIREENEEQLKRMTEMA